MNRYAIVLVVLASAAFLFAQSKNAPAKSAPPAKSTPAPAKSAPTKVSGKPQTTASGVEYWDIKVGNGALAQKGKTVTVNYTGWLMDGTEFDSSLDREEPLDFPLGAGKVIKGWDEGVAGMRVGGKRQLKIPASAAYGATGVPKVIPPNAILIFDVELLKVSK